MNSKILSVLQGSNIEPSPIWMMRQAGRHLPEYLEVRASAKDFIDFCFTPKKASEVTLQPVRRYDMDAAILFADILLIPIGLGRDVHFEKGIGPILTPITANDILKLTIDGAAERISSVFETVSLVRSELDKDKALIGFCGGPWTVATYMIEGRGSPTKEVAKRFAYNHPEAMSDLLEALVISSADYLIGQAKAGADVLKIFESWSEGLSPYQFETLVMEPTKALIKRVRAAGITVPIIGFPRGAGEKSIIYAQETGINAMAIGTESSLSWAREQLGADFPIQGNLDPLALRIGGSVLRDAVERVLQDANGPHIFNLGHGVSPDVKIENVHAVINHVRGHEANYV